MTGKKPIKGVVVGRNVHYVQQNGWHSHANITRVWNSHEGVVNLVVFRDDDLVDTSRITSVKYSENKEQGTWHFIEAE